MVFVFLGYFVLFTTVLCDCDENLSSPDVNNNFTQFIYLQFYQGPTVDDYISLPYKNALNLTNLLKFRKNAETVFYFPGWTEQPANHEESVDLIASAFLSKNSTNLVVFNYYQLVKGPNYFAYLDAFMNVTNIGKSIGYFLKCYIPREQSIDLIHLVGHSLGGQIMSQSARVYGKGKLEWLTGLDPAGPLFNLPLMDHLSKQDAKFVDVIHTDGNFYGDGRSVGNVDFFPNMGRREQPGCDNTTNVFCSHHMSWRFYAASIRNKTLFPAKQCNYNWFCNNFGIQNHFPYCCDHVSFVNHMGYGVNKTLQVNTMEFCNIGLKWKRNIPEIIHNVNFLYHQGPTVNDYIRFPYSRGIEIADQRYFNVFFETVFYFPGWQEDPSANTESVDTICSAFLSNGNVNFVAIDYSQLVKGNDLESYISAVLNATDVGQVVGNFLHLFIPEKQSINYVHLIGFGLGAQIMSHAASEFGSGKLKWLTGLDPAGAIFNLPMIKHLKKEDAEFVDVIHTDANFFGDGRSIGHVDFFPNEGTRFQPFCRRYLDDDFCSHNMAWRYYAESIKNMNYFPARAFKFYWYLYMTMKFPWCDEENTENINMGYGVNKKARGNYLLKTSDFPPYNLGFRGTVIDEVNEDWCGQRNKQVKDTLSEL